ncbi:MAG: glucokinase [Gammaproteobacteria bacterium]
MNLLVGDIGGTHTRLAVYDGRSLHPPRVFDNDAYESIYTLLDSCLPGLDSALRPSRARFAIAAPVNGRQVRLTNRDWEFDCDRLEKQLDVPSVELLNDFMALALAVPKLGTESLQKIGGGAPVEHAAKALLGPGTGLGMAGLVWTGERWLPVPGEGGHASLAADAPRLLDLLRRMPKGAEYVSNEDALSGPGLQHLYAAFAEGADNSVPAPEEIIRRAGAGEQRAVQTLDAFVALLAGVAGNLALTFNARGGVYLAGGVLPGIPPERWQSAFRSAFVRKGNWTEYLEAIPTWLVTDPFATLRGLIVAGGG